MPIISDREPVIMLAKTQLSTMRSLTPQAASLLALRTYFHLCDSDGIWGGSEAAVCMGFIGRSCDDDLLHEIATDVAAAIS